MKGAPETVVSVSKNTEDESGEASALRDYDIPKTRDPEIVATKQLNTVNGGV